MKLSALKVSSAAIEAGRWVEAPGLPGVQLRVRGLGNADYRRLQAKLIEQVPRNKRFGGRLDPDEQDKIVGKLLAEAVLLDWRGLDGDDDQPLAYGKDEAERLMLDPDYRLFRDAVMAAAAMVGEEDGAAAEDDAKN